MPLVGAFASGVHLVEHDDLGRVLVDGLERRHVHRTEAQCERELLVVADRLVAEEEDEVVEERLAHDLHVDVAQLLAQVEAAHLGPDHRGERRDLDRRHGRGPPGGAGAAALFSRS